MYSLAFVLRHSDGSQSWEISSLQFKTKEDAEKHAKTHGGTKFKVLKFDHQKVVTYKRAASIAASWHGGQSSALYSFASTGKLFLYLANEYLCETAVCMAKTPTQAKELIQLWTFFKNWPEPKK